MDSNIVNLPPNNKSGLYKAPLHTEGGVQVIVDGVKKIEVEGEEYHLSRLVLMNNKEYEFKNKTNLEILDYIFKDNKSVFVQGQANASDYIICRLAVLDKTKHDFYGTAKDFVNLIQGEHGCKTTGNNDYTYEHRLGGSISNKGIKKNDLEFKVTEQELPYKGNPNAKWVKVTHITKDGETLMQGVAIDLYGSKEKAVEAAKEKIKSKLKKESDKQELQDLIDLFKEAVKENPNDQESKDLLELYEENLKEFDSRFENGGELNAEETIVNAPCINEKFNFVESSDYNEYRKGGSVKGMSEDELKEFYNTKEGKELDRQTHDKWKKLVNMSKSELETFYNSEEGKEAGLSASEAKELGIDSGRESARWIMKMKDIPYTEWTSDMWRWAKKQIRFISRMSGVKGDLYNDKGNKTPKHNALLIWGHNPEKYEDGGGIKGNSESFDKAINKMIADGTNSAGNKTQVAVAAEFIRDFDLENDFLIKSKYVDLSYWVKKAMPIHTGDYNNLVQSLYARQQANEINPTSLQFIYSFYPSDVLKFIPNWIIKAKKELKAQSPYLTEDTIAYANDYVSRLEAFVPIALKFEQMKSKIGVKKELTKEEKAQKERQKIQDDIYDSMPVINKESLSKLVSDIQKEFKPLEIEIYNREVKRYRELCQEYSKKEKVFAGEFDRVFPFGLSVFNFKVISAYEMNETKGYKDMVKYVTKLELKPDWINILNGIVKAHVETLKWRMIQSVIKNFEKVTSPIKKITKNYLTVGTEGFQGSFLIEFKNGGSFDFKTEAIGAGGYNIQVFHFRYISNFTDIKMPDGSKGNWHDLVSDDEFENGGEIKSTETKPIRFEAGKKLTELEKKEVYRNLNDSYKVNNRPVTEENDRIVWLGNASDYMTNSDITGRLLRWYIYLPDGRIAHPTEVFGDSVTMSEIDRVQKNIESNEFWAKREYDQVFESLQKQDEVSKVVNAIHTAITYGAIFKEDYDSTDIGKKHKRVRLLFENGNNLSIPEYVINTKGSYLGIEKSDWVKHKIGEVRNRFLNFQLSEIDWERFYNENIQFVNSDDKMEDGGEIEDTKWVSCPRCGGRGELELYRHINAGVCFECNGKGVVPNYKIKEIKDKMVLSRKKYDEKNKMILDEQRAKDERVLKRKHLVAKELNEKIIELRVKNTDLNTLLKRDDFQTVLRFAERKNVKNGEEFIEIIKDFAETLLSPYHRFYIEKYLRETYNYYGYLNYKDDINDLFLFDSRGLTKEQSKVEEELKDEYRKIYEKIGRYDDDVIQDRPRGLDKMENGGEVDNSEMDNFDWMSVFREDTAEEKELREQEQKISAEKEKEDWYQKSGWSRQYAPTYNDAIAKTVKSYLDAKASYEDWGSRHYKSNKGIVYAGGDDIHGEAYTIGGINENRKRNRMMGAKMQMDESIELLKELGLNKDEISDLIGTDKFSKGGNVSVNKVSVYQTNFSGLSFSDLGGYFDSNFTDVIDIENENVILKDAPIFLFFKEPYDTRYSEKISIDDVIGAMIPKKMEKDARTIFDKRFISYVVYSDDATNEDKIEAIKKLSDINEDIILK